ncbi:hypothetical protein L249_8758 [Ophiocordyceps polyrhachis-furcata BCC 54312]|uniref:Inclusion body clearance protein IML2 n=1 Tax=Ophiocordyceps polyrhachis-furcata BCC 54312 TaxID=1330021 RepID=A0A367L6M4_9HYPO|nr:hypothetical protein L249_8758 [Ophiocordyceps polyrhachis-furcata BCC 54312]
MPLISWFRSGGDDGSKVDDVAAAAAAAAAAATAKHHADLADALRWLGIMMNDDLDRALDELRKGDSCFHDFGSAIALFLRAMLGLEKAVLAETATALAELETRAWNDAKAAQRAAASTSSVANARRRVYPPGTEYDLIRAEAQLMGAVLGVLQESIVEAMRGFYKLRRAYVVLEGIVDIEVKARATPAAAEGEGGEAESSSGADSSSGVDSAGRSAARTDRSSAATTPEPAELTETGSGTTTKHKSGDDDVLDLDDPVDDFIHGSANTSFGLVLLLLSLTPPAFSRILSAVGFRGDRERGVHLLWRSSSREDISGVFSGMLLLGFYNVLVGSVDIMPDEQDSKGDREAEALGPPRARCRRLLAEMRARYPQSQLWRIEEARMLAGQRRLSDAMALLRSGPEPKMKQVAALSAFELGVSAMAAQDWVLARDTFMHCVEISNWSPAMYDYMAGCASLELYRDGGPDAAQHKRQAEKLLRRAPVTAGRKRLLARQLPVEVFLQRRVRGWDARATSLGVDLADAVGPSPGMEMCYVWNAQRRMSDEELRRAEVLLGWERCHQGAVVEAIRADRSEVAVWAVNTAAVLRAQGRLEEAREVLGREVLAYDGSEFKGTHKVDYALPATTCELSAIAWDECCRATTAEERRAKLDECEAELQRADEWEAFSLEARLGMRIQAGRQTVEWLRKKMGWKKGDS